MEKKIQGVNFKHGALHWKKYYNFITRNVFKLYSFQKNAVQFCTFCQAQGHHCSFSDLSPLKMITESTVILHTEEIENLPKKELMDIHINMQKIELRSLTFLRLLSSYSHPSYSGDTCYLLYFFFPPDPRSV